MAGREGTRFPMRLLGMGLFIAWEILVSPFERACGLTDARAGLMTALPADQAGPLLFSALTAVLLAAAALADRAGRGVDWDASRWACVACGACALAATGLVALAGRVAGDGAGAALYAVAILCKGVADAGMFLLWNARLSRHSARVAWVAYAGSFVLAPCAYLLASAVGDVAVTAAVVVLPVASCALLVMSGRLPQDGGEERASGPWRFPWQPVVLVVVFSVAYRMVMGAGAGVQWADELGRLVMAAVTLACLLAAFDRLDEGLLYRVCPAITVAGLLVCMLGTLGVGGMGRDGGAGSLLVGMGYSGITLYVYLALNAACFRFGARPAWLFGLTRAACLAANVAYEAASIALGGAEFGPTPSGGETGVVATCVVVVALVLLSMLLMAQRTSITAWCRPSLARRGDPGAPNDGEGPAAAAGEGGAGAGRSVYLEDHVYRCAMVARHYGLTHREEEVLSLICQGTPFAEIESVLSIAQSTLKVHSQHIYAKLGVHSRQEARRVVEEWRP
ncbi:helix-turn-helix transcriptional regulator [bacterium]|nr:helix-turn-helix transcriptional regulator [bacterium]